MKRLLARPAALLAAVFALVQVSARPAVSQEKTPATLTVPAGFSVSVFASGLTGGRQRDLTFGANWYLTSHFKFQANYVHVLDEKRSAYSASDAVELRGQVQF